MSADQYSGITGEPTMLSIKSKAQVLHSSLKWPIILYGILASAYIASVPGKYIWFSWHPAMMILGFVALAANAALIKKIGGYENTKNHGYLMSAACVMAGFGFYVIYSNKEMSNKKHFMTTHGKLGLAVLVGYFMIGLFGAVALHPDWGMLKKNNMYRSAHKWGGRALTAASWFSCVLGFMTLQRELWKQLLFGVPLVVGGFYILL
jgi:hypothetical protein